MAEVAKQEFVQALLDIVVENVRWFLIGVMVLFGTSFVLFAEIGLSKENLWYDLSRDIGIAFIVSALVSIIFETYARLRFELGLVKGVANLLIEEWSREDIWEQVKAHILTKQVIREKFRMKLKLYPDNRLPDGQMVLWIETRYELHGLRSSPVTIRIKHFNDRHLALGNGNLPCFELIKIGDRIYPAESVKDGRFEADVDLEPRDGKPVEVLLRRKEIIYVPGIHYYTMTEMTKGIELSLEEFPGHFEAIFAMRPHKDDLRLEVNPDREQKHENVLLLPGQGIEFLFKRKPDPAKKGGHEYARAEAG